MSLSRKMRFAANPAEISVVARSAALLAAIPPLLKFANMERIVRTLTPARPRTGDRALPPERVTYLCHRTFGLAGRISYRPNCLRRALVQYHCLRLHGVPAVIQFGAKRSDGGLAGHCWLTVGGSLYDERADMVSQFARMFSLPSSEGEPPRDLRGLSFGK